EGGGGGAVGFRVLVERGAADAEILLRRPGAAVALRRGADGDVVDQALRRRADDGDDVGAGLRRGARLVGVVVDVAGGDDDVLERRLPGAEAGAVGLAVAARGVDAVEGGAGRLGPGAGDLPPRGLARGPLPARGAGLGRRLRVGGAADELRPDVPGDAAPEPAVGADALDAGVDQGHAVRVGALDAVGAEDGPLDRHRGVLADEGHDAAGDGAGQLA